MSRYHVYRQTKQQAEPQQVLQTDNYTAAQAHAKRIGNATNWVYIYDSEQDDTVSELHT